MPGIRKLLLLGAVALLACAVTSSAFAVQARTGSTSGTPLSVGAALTAINIGNVVLSGTFFGIPNTTTCTGSTLTGNVQANATASGNVWGKITGLSFAGCSSTAYPGGCTVAVVGLTWDPTTNNGGFEAISSTSVRLGTGFAGALDVSDCQPNKSNCDLDGGTQGPATDGIYDLGYYLTGTWTNSATSAQLSINSAVGIVQCTATSTKWTARYRVTAGGSQVYLG